MSAKATWFWLILAATLFAAILCIRHYRPKAPDTPSRLLPQLKPTAVTIVQVRPAGTNQLEIRAERTNSLWQLVQPLAYPAQIASIEGLLAYLAELIPATHITAAEIRARPKVEEEYGFSSPEACSIILDQEGHRTHILIGSRTSPGDQVFLQVVSSEGAFVVDAELLKYIPRSVSDWRDTTLANLAGATVDRLAITNNAKAFVLQRDATNRLWRIAWPLDQARADNSRIEDSLQKLQTMRIVQFVSDDPKLDLEPLGLAPPELELALGHSTNVLIGLQFGKSPTNDPTHVYARRHGQNTVMLVAKDLLDPWRRATVNEFRDPRLLTLTEPVQSIEARGPEPFSLERQTNGAWRVLPENFPADTELATALVGALGSMQIAEFTKDVVNATEWPRWGLAPPVREYLLKAASTNGSSLTNLVLADVSFGTNQDDKVFVRRADENSVYAVKSVLFQQLPAAGWAMRERRVWRFSENDIARVTLRQQARVRQMDRKASYQWSLVAGSQGIIEELPVEETVRGLVQVSAIAWVARGETNRPAYGLAEPAHQVTFELKNGEKATIEFGREAPSRARYAAVSLDGQLWIFELPWALYRDVATYLSVPNS